MNACKRFEEQNPSDIRLYQLDPMPNGYWYPFPFFKPDDNAIYGSYKIDETGNTQAITDHREIGLVNEQTSIEWQNKHVLEFPKFIQPCTNLLYINEISIRMEKRNLNLEVTPKRT